MDKFPEKINGGDFVTAAAAWPGSGEVRFNIQYDSTLGATLRADNSHTPVEPPIHLPAGGQVWIDFTGMAAYDAAGNRIAVYELRDGKFTPEETP